MKIIKPGFEFITPINGGVILKRLEECGRVCYKSEGKITVIEPCYLNENTFAYDEWKEACRRAETAYFNLLNWGLSPQEARAVLPNSLKTEVVMTANIREWRHFLRLRTSTGAHPQIREIATPLLRELQQIVPVCFDDILPKEADHETS